MQREATPIPIPVSRSGVCVVDGYGARLSVERGRLVIRDVLEGRPREARFARATAGIHRLVLLAHAGMVTVDAVRWLADVGIGFVHLDRDGRLLTSSANFGLDDPRLRRAQAMAWGTPTAIAIARDLLRDKLAGQAQVAAILPNGERTSELIRLLAEELDTAGTVSDLMVVEAAAANDYCTAWAALPFPFVCRDFQRVPDHWRTFGPRASPLTGNPRLAANPGQALLNYSYALLEGEARLSCLASGLDPGLGVLHADLKARDSLALDVMEAVRPDVDRMVLELVRRDVFRADDFVEGRNGVCRLRPAIAHRLAERLPLLARKLGPVVECVASAFADAPASRVSSLPTKLTEAKRSAGRRRLHGVVRQAAARRPVERHQPRCRGCGVDVGEHKRWCETCRPAALRVGSTEALEIGRRKRMELRAQGRDPATSEEAKAKQREARLRRRAEQRVWEADGGQVAGDEAYWRENLLPLLAEVPLKRLAEATGLSEPYCSEIRRGKKVPHPRWWEALENAATAIDRAVG